MFNLFRKKEPTLQLNNRIWLHKTEKFTACLALAEKPITFFCWFEDTVNELNTFFQQHHIASRAILYRTFRGNQDFVFVEHHPSYQHEINFFNNHQILQATFLCSLDEPFFTHFGGERIIELLTKLGINAHEEIQHSYINSSITKAQQKIDSNLSFEQNARNCKDWLLKNVK